MTMKVLKDYEKTSSQLVNREKNAFYMHRNTSSELRQVVSSITGFKSGSFPFKYIGCPIFHTKKKKVFYNELIKKIKDWLHIGKKSNYLLGVKLCYSIMFFRVCPYIYYQLWPQQNSPLMKFTEFLQVFFGATKRKKEADIGLNG